MAIQHIKCVVWDLDDCLWHGTLAESDNVALKDGVKDIIVSLDERGILNSVCSKNEFNIALRKLEEFGLADYFLYPEISWAPKSAGIKRIQENLNIGIDTIAFIDDQPFEREEVLAVHPSVICFDAEDYRSLLDHESLTRVVVTSEGRQRRALYQAQIARDREEEHASTPEAFLKSLNLELKVYEARGEDVSRLGELTLRTNQMNTTGIHYSADDLLDLIRSEDFIVLVCELTDRFGSYGKIGLSVIERRGDDWVIKLFLMSCRVVSRGVGSVFLSVICRLCHEQNKRLVAHFKRTERNRMMYVLYKFMRFEHVDQDADGLIELVNDLQKIPSTPDHIKLEIGPISAD